MRASSKLGRYIPCSRAGARKSPYMRQSRQTPADTRASKERSMATNTEQNTMGKRIFLVRVVSGLTQGQFAAFVGLPRQAVTAYESGQAVPLEVLFLLCDKFNVTWTWMLTGNGPMYSSPDL